MPGLLDENYGVADARKERRTKRIILGAVLVAVVGTFVYFYFRTWSEERLVNRFLATLAQHDYQGAYSMWGCTPEKPCANYTPERFNRDWGPDSPYSKTSGAQIANADYCGDGDGVVVLVNYPNQEPVSLWVDKSTKVLSFAPWPRCPGRHWEFKRFFNRLFSKNSE